MWVRKVEDVSSILFLNSLKSTGIGEFGSRLWNELLKQDSIKFRYAETTPTWRSLLVNWKSIFSFPGSVIVNLGYTSYGRSTFRNFINLVLIGIVDLLAQNKMKVILHDSPSLYSKRTSGYRHYRLINTGSSVASRALRNVPVLVFSVELHSILRNKSRLNRVKLLPFPCFSQPSKNAKSEVSHKKNIVLHLGYIAPYKGLDLLPEIKRLCTGIDFIVTGNWHRVLSTTVEGKRYFDALKTQLETAQIFLSDYISDELLRKLCSENNVVGILPYNLTSGSSYSATFLMERGIPLIATKLPEFDWMIKNGGGILTVERKPEEFQKAIMKVFLDVELFNSLSKKNEIYCLTNQPTRIIEFLTSGCELHA